MDRNELAALIGTTPAPRTPRKEPISRACATLEHLRARARAEKERGDRHRARYGPSAHESAARADEDAPERGRVYSLAKLAETGTWADSAVEEESAGEAFDIRETENRRGAFFLLVLPHVKGDAFKARARRVEDAGGWYSRKWGAAPAGWGFPSEEAALSFARAETRGEGGAS